MKPSLVEWKLKVLKKNMVVVNILETFLGGMETASECGEEYVFENLETFLGGMETRFGYINFKFIVNP